MNIHNDIITLRALEPTDLDVLYRWENNVKLWHTSSTIAPFSRKQLWDYIESYDGDIYRTRQLRLMIEENVTKSVIGTLDLFDFDPVNSRASVGILIDNTYQRMGYGKTAMLLLEKYCCQFLSLNQLVAVVAVNNVSSLELFATIGYREVGTLKYWLKQNQDYVDAIMFQKKICL